MTTETLNMMRSVFLSGILIACFSQAVPVSAAGQDNAHAQHNLTDAQFAELREKVPLYREFSNEQIMKNMARMKPGFHVYLSGAKQTGKIGVLALAHGYSNSGNESFKNAYLPTAVKHPTSVAFGMAMMSSEFIQTAVDELTNAGAETVVVIPVTTLKTGALIEQWRYIFGERAEAPWMSVDRVQTDAHVVFGPTPTGGVLISAILLDYALERSSDPANEVVAILAHGPDDAEENTAELVLLEQHAAVIREGRAFSEVRGFTLQDDAPSAIRQANVDRVRAWIQAAVDRGQRVIIVTTLPVNGNVQKKIRRDLKGLEYDLNDKGIVEHPHFSDWVESVISSSAE